MPCCSHCVLYQHVILVGSHANETLSDNGRTYILEIMRFFLYIKIYQLNVKLVDRLHELEPPW